MRERNRGVAYLLGVGLSFAQAEGVEEVEGDGVGDEVFVLAELGELSRLSSAHVMGPGRLAEPLQETYEEDDLPLGGVGEGVPLLGGGAGELGDVACHVLGAGEVDSVGLDAVTDEGGHGDAGVLYLGVAEEADGGVLGLAPEGGVGQLERVEVAEEGVELLGVGD